MVLLSRWFEKHKVPGLQIGLGNPESPQRLLPSGTGQFDSK
jgi:hypothetical protein